jgi:hypothetical protein
VSIKYVRPVREVGIKLDSVQVDGIWCQVGVGCGQSISVSSAVAMRMNELSRSLDVGATESNTSGLGIEGWGGTGWVSVVKVTLKTLFHTGSRVNVTWSHGE